MFHIGDKVSIDGFSLQFTVKKRYSAFGQTFYDCESNLIKLTVNDHVVKAWTGQVEEQKSPKPQEHQCKTFKTYNGFTETYKYCVDCDKKLSN